MATQIDDFKTRSVTKQVTLRRAKASPIVPETKAGPNARGFRSSRGSNRQATFRAITYEIARKYSKKFTRVARILRSYDIIAAGTYPQLHRAPRPSSVAVQDPKLQAVQPQDKFPITRAQEKNKASSNKAASASTAPSASRSALFSEKDKHKAEQALVRQNIEKSIVALVKEAIHVSATPTRLEDAEKYLKGVMAAAKKIQTAHQREQAAIAAAQAAADALEPLNDELLGISPEDAKDETESPLDNRGYLKKEGDNSRLHPRLRQICAKDDLVVPSVGVEVETNEATDDGTAEAGAESEPEADADGEGNANNDNDDNPPNDDGDSENNVDDDDADANERGGDGGDPTVPPTSPTP